MIPEEEWRIYQLKHNDKNNEDKDMWINNLQNVYDIEF